MRIIIVEDEEGARKTIVALIQIAGSYYDIVAQATDGRKGFELIKKLKPDLVFTDVRMPNVNGLELIRLVREEGLDTQFAIISAYEEFEYAKTAMKLGVKEYIVKPIIIDDIEGVLQRAAEITAHAAPAKTPVLGENMHPSVAKALSIIDHEYAAGITQDVLARRLRITPQYFSYLFHRDMGVSFSTYLKQLRIDIAKSLLADTDMKINEIAEATGFNDAKYFYRVFKSVTGTTPNEFAK